MCTGRDERQPSARCIIAVDLEYQALPCLWYHCLFIGKSLAGTEGDPVELIQTLPQRGSLTQYEVPGISPSAAGAVVRWWSDRLNEMFGVLTTPGVFADAGGTYQAATHIQGLATVEQLFRRVGAIQVAVRDANARLVLLFSVLDTLQTLTARDLTKHCTLSFAEQTLRRLKEKLQPDAAQVLLPAAERAINALREVQAGFYIFQQSGRSVLELKLPNGEMAELAPERAAAAYIKLLRDANHGHGAKTPAKAQLTNALLGQHSGHMPHDLALLGYLYLLDVLANPDRLRRCLYTGKRG
jgi:hypothetical protein